MKKLGNLKTKTSKEITNSKFAIHYCEPKGDDLELSAKRLSESGVKWVRYYYDTVWSLVEKEKGKYDFEDIDRHIDKFDEYGIKPFIQLGGGNFHYTEGLTGYQPCDDPAALAGFLGYVEAMVSRYKDRIFYWEVWNEVNLYNFWKPRVDLDQYADLLCKISEIIRKYQGDKAVIIAASFSGIHPDVIEKFMQTKACGCFDVFAFHPYNSHPESTLSEILEARDVVAKYDKNVVLWNSECGFPSSGDTICGRPLSPWGYKIQGKWLLRRALVDFIADLEMSTYYMLTDVVCTQDQYDRRAVNVNPDQPVCHYVGTNTKGLISFEDGKVKPAFYAIQNINTILDNAKTRVDLNAEFKITNEGCFYGAGKSAREFLNPMHLSYSAKAGGNMLIYHLPWVMQEVIEPATVDISVEIGAFTDPVLVDLLNGEVYEISFKKQDTSLIFPDMPLADYPMALVERNAIEF